MARFVGPFEARIQHSTAGKRGGVSPAFAAISLVFLASTALAPAPAAGEKVGERFSFTGTFRYESRPERELNALHLPPETVPIPVQSHARREAMDPTPLPTIVPRALLGTKASSASQPFATDKRSMLGVPDPATGGAAIPATRGAERAGETLPDIKARDSNPNESPSSGDSASRQTALTRDSFERDATNRQRTAPARTLRTKRTARARSRSRAPLPSSLRRNAPAGGTGAGAGASNTILAPTPAWAKRAFHDEK